MNKTTEELSVALDQLNCGRTVETDDQEIKELLEVASLLRNANLPARPPDHLLATSVERADAGLAAHKQSRRTPWLYSGLLGAAAALLVFVGIHGFPSIQDVAQQTTPPPRIAPATEKPAPPSTPDASPSSQTTTAHRATSPEKPPVVNSPGVVPASPVERTELAAPPPSTRSTPAASPSLKSAIPPPPAVEKSLPANSAPLPPLQLPGRTPDSITKDVAGGSVRQVFNSGTPQELVITQRRLPQLDKDGDLHAKSQAVPEMARKYSTGPTNLNKVVITINGQEVTLEGRQTVEELAALAKLLKP